jgi:hypothetical protein
MAKLINKYTRLVASMLVVLGVNSVLAGQAFAYGNGHGHDEDMHDDKPVTVDMFAPARGDHVGIGGRGWFVDLAIQYNTTLDKSGFSAFQLTGPATHNNVAPFPGTFSAGTDDRLPGLIVLVSTTTVGAKSCQNIANLFNLTGVTNVTDEGVELWDTWLVGAPNFGVDTESMIYVAVADDLNGDGIYNDAPGMVADANGDGMCNAKDLKAVGLASNVAKAKFYINP